MIPLTLFRTPTPPPLFHQPATSISQICLLGSDRRPPARGVPRVVHTYAYAHVCSFFIREHRDASYAHVRLRMRDLHRLLRPHVCLPMQHTLTHTYACVICGGRGLDGLREDALDFADALNNREVYILVAHLYDHAAQQRFVHLCVCVCGLFAGFTF